MNINNFFLIILCILVFGSCKDTNPDESQENNSPSIDTTAVKPAPVPKTVTVYAWVDKLRMREEPDTKSPIVEEIPEGGSLTFLDEKSDFTETFTLRGKTYDEPWLKVKTTGGKVGWVYGGGVKFYQPKVAATPSPYDGCMDYFKRRRVSQAKSCFERIEAKQLKKDKAHVSQIGDGALKFRLLSGEEIVLDDRNAENDSLKQDHFYRYYIPKMSSFVVETNNSFSDYRYKLINDKSGKTTPIWGFPAPSPDYKHLLSIHAGLKSKEGKNGVQILGYTDRGLQVVWEKELDKYEPIIMKWLDLEEAEITMLPKSGNLKLKIAELTKDEQGEWQLNMD